MLLFDLPMVDKNKQKEYRFFRKNLKKNAYIQLQESVYVKLLHNTTNAYLEIERIRSISPQDGNIKLIPMSLNGFKKMLSIRGTEFNMSIFSDDVVIID